MLKVDCEKYAEDFSALAAAAFDELGLSGNATVEVEFVTADEIHELNRRTRGVDRATDVLSYPTLDEIKPFTKENYPFDYDAQADAVEIGSIVICEEVALGQAEEYGHSVRRENCYLFTHGLMHLMGYDHIEESDRAAMREREEAVLNRCGVTRGD